MSPKRVTLVPYVSLLLAAWMTAIANFPALAAQRAAPAGPTGTLVIVGGAVKNANDDVWGAVVSAAGGPGALVLVLPTASSSPDVAASIASTSSEKSARSGTATGSMSFIHARWGSMEKVGAGNTSLSPGRLNARTAESSTSSEPHPVTTCTDSTPASAPSAR